MGKNLFTSLVLSFEQLQESAESDQKNNVFYFSVNSREENIL